jgi:hypothetical protein
MLPGELVYMRDYCTGTGHQVKVAKVTDLYVFVARLDGRNFVSGTTKKFVKETSWEWVSPRENRVPRWQLGRFVPEER